MTQREAELGFLTGDELAALKHARANHKPFLASGKRDRVAEFFSMAEFSELVNQTGIWTPERMEVILDTRKVPPPGIFTQMPVLNGVRYRLQGERLQKLLDRGASVVLNEIESLGPGLRRLGGSIAGFTGGRIQCNFYYSQRDHQAFGVHFDVHDVYAFQIAGEKRWQIHQQICHHPINHLAFLAIDQARHERQKGAVSMDVTLRAGDFLYLPAGYYHQAMCTGPMSGHLTFSVVEMIGLDLISELFDTAVLKEFFRTPIGRSVREGKQPMADCLAALGKNIEALLADEAFVRAMEDKLKSFPYPAKEVAFKKDGEG